MILKTKTLHHSTTTLPSEAIFVKTNAEEKHIKQTISRRRTTEFVCQLLMVSHLCRRKKSERKIKEEEKT